MKKYFISSVLILSIVVGGYAFLKTQLILTIINDLGNIEVGAEVTLYESEDDYNNDKSAIETLKTNEKGKVRFYDLKPIVYFVKVEKGKKNNMFGGEKTEKLEAKKINKVNIVISE